jgi:hypothetical protein
VRFPVRLLVLGFELLDGNIVWRNVSVLAFVRLFRFFGWRRWDTVGLLALKVAKVVDIYTRFMRVVAVHRLRLGTYDILSLSLGIVFGFDRGTGSS